MLKLPRRTQVAKRPRLDLAPSGGSIPTSSVQVRQPMVHPPVFRRRPATPFNRPPGETGRTGDQAEGSGYAASNRNDEVGAGVNSLGIPADESSEDELSLTRSWPLPRRR